jgi:hypothetical protein
MNSQPEQAPCTEGPHDSRGAAPGTPRPTLRSAAIYSLCIVGSAAPQRWLWCLWLKGNLKARPSRVGVAPSEEEATRAALRLRGDAIAHPTAAEEHLRRRTPDRTPAPRPPAKRRASPQTAPPPAPKRRRVRKPKPRPAWRDLHEELRAALRSIRRGEGPPVPTAALRVLGLNPGAPVDEAQIGRAYHAQARRRHPDLGGDPAAFRELVQARDLVLGWVRRRAA